ncbi:hypothetical protein AB0O52_20105 [Arthrobacter sp. NPDC080073]|uniref:hypothetical protein n=1 Tax=Arthrobacter sp. NPDC080073 TaxID=3155919 RepID=UPI003431C542
MAEDSSLESPGAVREDLKQLFRYLLDNIQKFSNRLTPDDGVDIELLEGVLRLWLDLMDNLPDQTEPSEFVTLPYASAERIRAQVKTIWGYLESLQDLRLVNYHVEQLFSELESTIRRAGPDNNSMLWAVERVRVIKREVEARSQLKRLEKATSTAEESASRASQAAGTAGESAMSAHFDSLATKEARTANWFRGSTIGAMLSGGVLAAWLLLGPEVGVKALAIDAGDYVHLAQRVIATGAIFALAGYLAKQAHQHRTTANWARALAVQLQTFDAFMDPVQSDGAKDQLRIAFASHVFGEPPKTKTEPASSGSFSVVEKALDLAQNNLRH